MNLDRLLDGTAHDTWAAESRAAASRTAGAFATSGLLAQGALGPTGARLRSRRGDLLPFAPERWHSAPGPDEVEVLSALRGPVLDLACGPGRLVRHLVEAGVEALGIDTSHDAVAAAARRGAPAILADIWAPLPGEGGWASVLLFDGNIGIGAGPSALLGRCAEMLAPGGTLVVEVGPRGSGSGPIEARIEWGPWRSPWFPWATVGLEELPELADGTGLALVGVGGRGARRFGHLTLD